MDEPGTEDTRPLGPLAASEQRVAARSKLRRRRLIRTILIAVVAVIAIVAIVVGTYVGGIAHTFDDKTVKLEKVFPDGDRPEAAGGGVKNILLLGSDTRGSLADLNNAAGSDQRADTIMLIHVPSDGKGMYGMSIMRDSWVDIPGSGQGKINSAMAIGGIPLLVKTLEGMLGTRIDNVAALDFAGFEKLTDAIGGVSVNVPQDFKAIDGLTFKAGQQVLDGAHALAFVRERHAFADGDYQRVKDQQTYLKSLMNKMLSPSVLANPGMVSHAVSEFAPYLGVDRSFTSGDVMGLGWKLRSVRGNDVHMFTLPNSGTSFSSDGQSIIVVDEKAVADVGKALRNDTMAQYIADHPDGQQR
ncbi:LCP family protein [Tersicoccus sp. Bi-70]|uniref:LCP family protein n=1 Tax=Tersicoccus sp. Bi-70 TaxID=1897634 RepID=UPI0009F975E5|nr:LCP family protein [Tersicoccus sp. Bi-70]